MSPDTESLPDLDAWECDQLRLTVFLSEGSANPTDWWSHVVGTEPDKTEISPKKSLHVESGEYHDALVLMQLAAGRLDWFLLTRPDADEFGSWIERTACFAQLMDNWFSICPTAVRLAFGGVALLPTSNKEGSYQALSRYLGLSLNAANSSDFSYQINHPAISTVVPDIKINRLMKWSAIHRVSTTLTMHPSGGTVSASPVPTTHKCQLEVDINSASEYRGDLPTARLPGLFAEFRNYAEQIIRNGDR